MKTGYISLHRKILDNPISSKPEYFSVWVTLLLLANHSEQSFIWNNKKQICKRGQILTGRKELSNKTGVSESKVERILKYLENEQQIEQQTNNRFRLITINNYNAYQKSEQQSEQPVNNKRTTNEQPVNTNNNDNNSNNVNNVINISKDIQEIVDCFENSFNQKVRVISPKRKKHIQARLKVFSLEEVKLAIENFSASPFHTGDNDRGWVADLDFIIRSDENIEKGLKLNDFQVKNSSRTQKTPERAIMIDGLYFSERERDEILEKQAVFRDSEGYPRFKEGWIKLVSFKL